MIASDGFRTNSLGSAMKIQTKSKPVENGLDGIVDLHRRRRCPMRDGMRHAGVATGRSTVDDDNSAFSQWRVQRIVPHFINARHNLPIGEHVSDLNVLGKDIRTVREKDVVVGRNFNVIRTFVSAAIRMIERDSKICNVGDVGRLVKKAGDNRRCSICF